MARTVVDIDDEALAAAAAELGTTTKVDTVGFHRVTTLSDVWDRVLQVQSALAARGLQQSVKVPDLLVAAAAERAGIGLMHDDQDSDTIAEITGQRCEWVVPRGSAP